MVLGLKGRAWSVKTKLDLAAEHRVRIIRDILGRAEAKHVVKPSLAHVDYGVGPSLDEKAHRSDCSFI
ncbi:hypothetical protein CsSME_00016185 [Camellia sinensis var. sinensis]